MLSARRALVLATCSFILSIGAATACVVPTGDSVAGSDQALRGGNSRSAAAAFLCRYLDLGTSLCEGEGLTFFSDDLVLANCQKDRKGNYRCEADRSASVDMPREFWTLPSQGSLSCPDAVMQCEADVYGTFLCFCDDASGAGATQSKKGKVEYEWKVEEGES